MSIEKLRQYGVASYLRRAILSALRPMCQWETFLVLVIPDFTGSTFSNPMTYEISSTKVEQYAQNGHLTQEEVKQFHALLHEGSRGLAYEINGILAGYAWIQPEGGDYHYGHNGRMKVPPGYTIMKNLLVRRDFRGDGLGRILNQSRLAATPASLVPTVFIVTDNRYAIRNWETYGFRKALRVTERRLFSGRLRTNIKVLGNYSCVEALVRALREGTSLT